MSTPSSPPTTSVPYQAYKSKRHSRNLSSPNFHLTLNQSPPTGIGPPIPFLPPKLLLDGGKEESFNNELDESHIPQPGVSAERESEVSALVDDSSNSQVIQQRVTSTTDASDKEPNPGLQYPGDQVGSQNVIRPTSTPLGTGSHPTPKKTTTFRRLVPRSTRQSPASRTRNLSVSSLPPCLPEKVRNEAYSSSSPTLSPGAPEHIVLTPPNIHDLSRRQSNYLPQIPPPTPMTNVISTSNEPPVALPPPASASSSKHVPYRPGFQPRGIYRPLTDDFLAIRRSIRDGAGDGGIKRVERTKLERRLEKLIALHFPYHTSEMSRENSEQHLRPSFGHENRISSSFLDFRSLRSLNIHDAGDLFRGIVIGGLSDPTTSDIRAAEQRITPWQDDASVNKCPLCVSAFHPLSNRKHHCRLCGQIICSLPNKHPHRNALCSTLFVVDAHARQIEEVGEGVDYGVKRRKAAKNSDQPGRPQEEDKFLKGVRICRQCRPILLRQQYYEQSRVVPDFAKLYDKFISLEADIEESLPNFHELLMTLSVRDQPTKDASAARKRLLDSFAQYDKLSKTIRALPCPNGPGSSQDRVQAAIVTRANIFLQKNMFPLQSLPTPQPRSKVSGSRCETEGSEASHAIDNLDSALAHTLQPLLEQESLLESFVEEAQAQRKFEDVKTLKVNLAEIRQEIERVLNADKLH